MKARKPGLVRDSDTGDLLELLLVVAIATILINRAFLSMTGYPRIAFGSFHIAHMLWGGLLMLVALVLAFRYWNPSVRRMSSFISGIGFGLFIDELGKFITKDNDYFFKPTIAIIYLIFVILYLVFRKFSSDAHALTDHEESVNRKIRQVMAGYQKTESPWLKGYYCVRNRMVQLLSRMLSKHGFVTAVMLVFVLKSVLQFISILGWIDPGWLPLENLSGLSLAGAALSGILVIIGLVVMRSSRTSAAHWFKRAVILSIFVTQVFLFYQSQLTAIWGLFIDLLVYLCIDFYIKSHLEGKKA